MPEAAPKAAPAATSPQFTDPYRDYNFKLDLGAGQVEGHFTRCSNIGIRIQAISYREAGATQVRRIPGPVEYAEVVLHYGLTASKYLWDWFMLAAQGNVDRKNVSIILMDSAGSAEVTRWNLNRAWPKEWNGPALDARGRDVAIESITIVFETIERMP